MVLSLASTSLSAAALEPPQPPTDTSAHPEDSIYFDARQTTYDKNSQIQEFSGEVVAITNSLLMVADKIRVDRQNHALTAQGHVILAGREQVITGERVEVNLQTQEFTIHSAVILNQDSQKLSETTSKILGLSPLELDFEVSQKQFLSRLHHEKFALQRHYLQSNPSAAQQSELINQYALLLEQEEQIAKRSFFDQFPRLVTQYHNLAQRRAFWQEQQRKQQSAPTRSIGYFRLEGDLIRQTEEKHLIAQHGLFTPCYCQEGDTPAWGFRSKHIDAQIGGYADLENSSLEIKGIPVLYLPYLKFPLKSQRQSGWLFPDLSYHSRDGNIITSPLYFAINPWSDSTVTTNFIERRGWRLGVEYRYQHKNYSAWQISGEGIRDQTWLNSLAATEHYRSLYAAANPTSANLDEVMTNLSPPKNTWRGKASWQGLNLLTPHESLVSEGALTSDHRYENDFWYQYFVDTPSPLRPAFSRAAIALHSDHDGFYLGSNSSFADHTLSNTPFAGMQQPIQLNLQSKLHRLPLGSFYFPVYGQVSGRFFDFHLLKENTPPFRSSPEVFPLALDDAQWFGSQIKVYAPLNRNQALQVSLFSEFDARVIKNSPLLGPDQLPTYAEFPEGHAFSTSSINSLRSGLQFRLPIHGYYLLSRQEKPDSLSGLTTLRFFEHSMNWDVTLSLRPAAIRRGSYAEHYSLNRYSADLGSWQPLYNSEPLTYQASDNPTSDSNALVPEEYVMTPHQKILFKTDHQWFIREKQLSATTLETLGQNQQPQTPSRPHPTSYHDRARREIEQALDEITAHRQLEKDYFATINPGEINSGLSTTSEANPLGWNSAISYDYQKEKKRRSQAELYPQEELSLPEPWSPWLNRATAQGFGWGMSLGSEYNLYKKLFTETSVSVNTPTFFSLALSFLYKIEKEYQPVSNGGYGYFPRYTREYSLASELIPVIPMRFKYGETLRHNSANDEFSKEHLAAVGATYFGSSRCWGLKISWEKNYNQPDWVGTYYLGLVVNFFNTNRDLGNLVSRYNG